MLVNREQALAVYAISSCQKARVCQKTASRPVAFPVHACVRWRACCFQGLGRYSRRLRCITDETCRPFRLRLRLLRLRLRLILLLQEIVFVYRYRAKKSSQAPPAPLWKHFAGAHESGRKRVMCSWRQCRSGQARRMLAAFSMTLRYGCWRRAH